MGIVKYVATFIDDCVYIYLVLCVHTYAQH